ncbi:TrkH Potassium Transport [Abortiporus biennis]
MIDTLSDIYDWLKRELNFFRIHLLFFIFVPLVSAAIFWGANGRFPVAFIDALFLCYSALTVTGLSTVNLSTCTAFQQAILFFLMCIGNVTVIAWVMVLIRKNYFKQHLVSLHQQQSSKRRIGDRLKSYIGWTPQTEGQDPEKQGSDTTRSSTTNFDTLPKGNSKIRASEGIGAALVGGGATDIGFGFVMGARDKAVTKDTKTPEGLQLTTQEVEEPGSITSDPLNVEVASPTSLNSSFDFNGGGGLVASPSSNGGIPLTTTLSLTSARSQYAMQSINNILTSPVTSPRRDIRYRPGVPRPRRAQTMIQPPTISQGGYGSAYLGQRPKDQNFGGFPGPFQLTAKFARRYFPQVYERIKKFASQPVEVVKDGKSIRWLSEEFGSLIIGRNSDFNTDELTDEELEKLGGLEYRALHLLTYLVFFYFMGTQLISFILIAPWLSTTHTYDDVFNAQPRLVNKSWFAMFQIVGAYTGGGMSLVDAGMVPFQKAYLMIFSLIFAILAGNHGLPMFLRLSIWVLTKFVKDGSPTDNTLHFLLDHPLFFTALEWIAFIVLDIGLDVTESLPAGTRAVAGLFQSFAVRASGFAIVSLSSIAPSFQFLCVIMMYIAVYPVALSIRSTNVYEEKSLGVFASSPEEEEEEPEMTEKSGTRRERLGKYFGWHLRRQVAYDIWWLVCGIFLICVIERTKIMDEVNAPWFNLFRIVFELVSAFGGIGLSLGVPYDNFAFSGSFGPLSKLVVIVIMVRGRHRGLPVAIDRAIMLPEDLVPATGGSNQTQIDHTGDQQAQAQSPHHADIVPPLESTIVTNSTEKGLTTHISPSTA